MSVLFLSKPRVIQPRGLLQIDKSIAAAWLPYQSSIGAVALTKTGAGQVITTGGGVGFSPAGASYFLGSIKPASTYPQVLGVVAYPNAADSDWAGIGGASGVYNYLKIGQVASGGAKVTAAFRPQDSGSVNSLIISQEPATTGRFLTVFLVLRSATVADVFVNGKKYSAGATSALGVFSKIAIGAGVTNGAATSPGSGGAILAQFYGSADPGDAYWQSVSKNPWQLFSSRQALWMPDAGGGTTTITAIVGNAAADGTTAAITKTIATTVGNSAADGTTASLIRTIATSTGSAIADGPTAAVTRTLATTPGNAVADGTTASIVIDGNTTISCTPGNAVADGAMATVMRTITANPGNAVANGSIAALLRVIAAGPGNAVADGVTASILGATGIVCTPGNAVANGVTASIVGAPALPTAQSRSRIGPQSLVAKTRIGPQSLAAKTRIGEPAL